MKKTTSINTISGDDLKYLFPFRWIIWLILNIINNNFYPKYSLTKKNKHIVHFKPKITNTEWEEISTQNIISPSRVLCNLFWKKLNYKYIKEELGEINILDTGCGDGSYALKLNKYWDGINSYLGIDNFYNQNWDSLNKKYDFVKFLKISYLNIYKFIPKKTNIFISQSAIEHFHYDLEYFNQINKFIKSKKKNIIQIHLFPSPACLWLYLFHGFRQYNLRSILEIIDIFKNSTTYFKIYLLGGENSNKLHFKAITIPHFLFRDTFKFNKKKYFRDLAKSIQKDSEVSSKNPSFYALIIHSNFRNKIF